MTALTLPTRALDTATFDVYTRQVRSGTPPELGTLDDAGTGGWALDYELRFRQLRFAAWPSSGFAQLDYIPLSGGFDPIEENLLNNYWIDDQVRIEMFPPVFSSGAPIGIATGTAGGDTDRGGGSTSGGVMLFEGVLARQNFGVRATGSRDDEDTGLVAIDGPTIDNLDPAHVVRGRWVQDPGESAGTPYLIDAPQVPATFNAGGRPNMMPTLPMTGHDGGLGLSAQLFTFDGDYRADYWTARDAIVSTLVMWLYGHSTAGGTAKTRSATLETLTAKALLDDEIEGARWVGLDAILPETSVQGLSVYDAVAKICAAVGFEMPVPPPLGRRPPEADEEEEQVAPDRLYQVRLWRSGAGPDGSLRLQKRPPHSAASLTATQELKQNNVDQITGLVDATRSRNHCQATGPVLIETTVPLKPMWASADVSGAGLTARLQQMVLGNDTEQYTQRHVKDGSDFKTYGHVGRFWGVDCTGEFRAAGLGYTTPSDLAHDADGFDWLGHLGIDGDDALTAERTANNVADPIRWTNRPRKAMPLTRPGLVELKQPYILEVSEDGGTEWIELPAQSYKVHADRFTVQLTDIANLAMVNADTYIANAGSPAIDASWWGLIKTNNLRFRLTCLVEADHASRYDATPVAGSGSLYPRTSLVRSSAVTVWSHPGSILNGGSTWVKIDDGGYGSSTAGADREQLLQDLAQRIQDKQSPLRISVSGGTWIMDPAMLQVGDRILGIAGRNLPFLQTTPSGEVRSPSVVGVTLTGALEGAQGISFDLADEAMRRGV